MLGYYTVNTEPLNLPEKFLITPLLLVLSDMRDSHVKTAVCKSCWPLERLFLK